MAVTFTSNHGAYILVFDNLHFTKFFTVRTVPNSISDDSGWAERLGPPL